MHRLTSIDMNRHERLAARAGLYFPPSTKAKQWEHQDRHIYIPCHSILQNRCLPQHARAGGIHPAQCCREKRGRAGSSHPSGCPWGLSPGEQLCRMMLGKVTQELQRNTGKWQESPTASREEGSPFPSASGFLQGLAAIAHLQNHRKPEAQDALLSFSSTQAQGAVLFLPRLSKGCSGSA